MRKGLAQVTVPAPAKIAFRVRSLYDKTRLGRCDRSRSFTLRGEQPRPLVPKTMCRQSGGIIDHDGGCGARFAASSCCENRAMGVGWSANRFRVAQRSVVHATAFQYRFA